MPQSLCILGRQPALGLAELESLYGAENLQPITDKAVIVDIAPDTISFQRLGGTVKMCRVIAILDTADWRQLESHIIDSAPRHAQNLPEGKLKIGISAYGLGISAKQIQASALSLKKVLRDSGRSVRIVPNQEPELNSAQVLHNNLTGALGWELVLVRHGQKTILAQTVAVQDITAYARRDQARPKRDSRVGMLPPKLAQIIINIAAGNLLANQLSSKQTVLDPFCGTGVVLQEALLMGYSVIGTDLNPRMVQFSSENIDWLRERFPSMPGTVAIEQGDAADYLWLEPVAFVAAETYLGKPLFKLPNPQELSNMIAEIDDLHRKFLANLGGQISTETRVCLAVPAWKSSDGFIHLPMLDHLTDMGYNRMSFVHVKNDELVYHREDQIVARELVVLTRN